MNPAWPQSLPQKPLLNGLAEQAPNTLLRSNMETGPAKVRRRYTAGVRKFPVSFVLTEAQVATMDTFLQETLLGGALKFDWLHPRTGAAVTFRIIPESEETLNTYTPLGRGYWSTSLQVEALP